MQAASFQWPEGKRCAVSLSFDDSRDSQLDVAIPILNRHGVKATFYVHPDRVKTRLPAWKAAVASGHEIGNHTMSHPCSGNFSWSPNYRLEDYTLDRMELELDTVNASIENLLGVRIKSFAYPCGQTYVGRGTDVKSYVPLVASRFATGRLSRSIVANDPLLTDFAQLNGFTVDGVSWAELKLMLDITAARGLWLVLVGHDVGEPGPQATSSKLLETLIEHTKSPGSGIWLATVSEVADHVLSMNTSHTLVPSLSKQKPPGPRDTWTKLGLAFTAGLMVAMLAHKLLRGPIREIVVLCAVLGVVSSCAWLARFGYLGVRSLIGNFGALGLAAGSIVMGASGGTWLKGLAPEKSADPRTTHE